MFANIFTQIMLVVSVFNIFPADAAVFEYQADVGSLENSIMTSTELQIATLPNSDDRNVTSYPTKIKTESYGIVTSAESALVMDVESGMILLGKHPYEIRSIGSVTKLMTALVFLDQDPDLNEYKKLDWDLDLVEGGRIYLAFDNSLPLRDLLASSIIGSDNTATKSLVRFSGLSDDDFITAMNKKAVDLGMLSSTFTDPTGIDAGNLSTAMDLTKLLNAAQENQIIAKYMQMQYITVHHSSGLDITIKNTNTLLGGTMDSYPYKVIAGKTGYLPQAGYVLATVIEKDGNDIYVVVLGSDSKSLRIDEAKGLAYWAFNTFKW